MPSNVIETVQNLLSRAERSDSDAERELAMRHVQRLAKLHSIDLDTVRQQRSKVEGPQQPEVRVIVLGEKGNSYATAYLELFRSIADQNSVKWYFQGGKYRVNAIGYPFDLEITERLYAYLLPQMVLGGDEHVRGGGWRDDTHRGRAVTSREARLSYFQAFTDQIKRRLEEERLAAEREARAKDADTGNNTALVLVDKESQLRNMYRNEGAIRTAHTRSAMRSTTARGEGSESGRNVKLRPDKEIGTRRGIERGA